MNNKQTKEKLKEWLDSLPETVRQKESANVLAFVFFVEVFIGKIDPNQDVYYEIESGNGNYFFTTLEVDLSRSIENVIKAILRG